MRLNYIFMENQLLNTNYLYWHPGLFVMQGKPAVGENSRDCNSRSRCIFRCETISTELSVLVRFHLACACIPRHSKSNSIELNRTQSVDWVRLSSAIERNRTPHFQWVRSPNKSNSIEQIEHNLTQSVWLCSIEFGNRTQSNTIK